MDDRGRDHDDAQSNCGDGRNDGCDTSGVRKHQTDDAEDLASNSVAPTRNAQLIPVVDPSQPCVVSAAAKWAANAR